MKSIRTIGIRSTPGSIFFSIITSHGETIEINSIDTINCPKAMETPEQLKFVRNTLCDIINEFSVNKACVRITESNARQVNIPRIYIEGVIQELFASSTIEKYYAGQISSISANMGIKRADFKKYVDGDLAIQGIDNWHKLNKEKRESLMAAISAINY